MKIKFKEEDLNASPEDITFGKEYLIEEDCNGDWFFTDDCACDRSCDLLEGWDEPYELCEKYLVKEEEPEEEPEEDIELVPLVDNDDVKYRFTPVTYEDGTMDHYCYMRSIGGLDSEVDHAVKKLTFAGKRGSKDKLRDLEEALKSVKKAIELTKVELK